MKKNIHLMAAFIFLIAATSCENTVHVEPMAFIDIPFNFKYTDQCVNDWVQMARYQVYMDKLANDWNYLSIKLNMKMINAGCFDPDQSSNARFVYQVRTIREYLGLGINLIDLRQRFPTSNSIGQNIVFKMFPELVKKFELFGCVKPVQKIILQMDDFVDRFNGVGSRGRL